LAHPQIAPIIAGQVRRKPLRRFPYWILYSITNSRIRLLAVSHQRRRPLYWSGRV
jgi:hypothetical protein